MILIQIFLLQPVNEVVVEAWATKKFGNGTLGLIAPLHNRLNKTAIVCCNFAAKNNEHTVHFRVFNPAPEAVLLMKDIALEKFPPILIAKPYANNDKKSTDIECTCSCGSEFSKIQFSASYSYGKQD